MSDLKQIERLYSHSYLSFLATLFSAILVLWLFQSVAESLILNSWFAIFLILTFIRIVVSYHFEQSDQKNTETWLMIFLIMTLFSGVMWGITGFLFIPEGLLSQLDSVLYHGMLLLFIVALITGSIITYSASKMVYLYFSVPAIVPQCLMLISKGDIYHSFLGGYVLAYACIMFVVSIYINQIFSDYSKIETRNDFLNLTLKRHGIELE
jgi:uncharacterized membrane protein YfcA